MNRSLTVHEIENIEALRKAVWGKKVYLYGAGVRALSTLELLKQERIETAGFLVSTLNEKEKMKCSLPIIQADSFTENGAIVIFAIFVKNKEMCREIVDRNVCEIYWLGEEFYVEEFRTCFAYKMDRLLSNRGCKIMGSGAGKYQLLCKDREFYFMLEPTLVLDGNVELFSKKLGSMSPKELFEKEYGRFEYVLANAADKEAEKKNKKTYAIYMAQCHVDQEVDMPSLPEWVIPIQVGAVLTETRICSLTDDTGDNISDRNRDYSECTALYWMWKNAPEVDYIGLCHYRRHFDIKENEISLIGSRNYDIVATFPLMTADTRECFCQFVSYEDMELLKDVIRRLYPKYAGTADAFFDGSFFLPCNMTIMKQDIYRQYMAFVFGVAFACECHAKNKAVKNKRYMGYLIEMLTGIFIAHHKNQYRIGYVNMKYID